MIVCYVTRRGDDETGVESEENRQKTITDNEPRRTESGEYDATDRNRNMCASPKYLHPVLMAAANKESFITQNAVFALLLPPVIIDNVKHIPAIRPMNFHV